jgi:hypothetical protein
MFETEPGHLDRCLLTPDFQRDPGWDWNTVIAQESVR